MTGLCSLFLALFASRRGDLDDDVSCSDFRLPSHVGRVCAGFIPTSRFQVSSSRRGSGSLVSRPAAARSAVGGRCASRGPAASSLGSSPATLQPHAYHCVKCVKRKVLYAHLRENKQCKGAQRHAQARPRQLGAHAPSQIQKHGPRSCAPRRHHARMPCESRPTPPALDTLAMQRPWSR